MIYIVGAPRSGTTSLADAISRSATGSALRYKELNFLAEDIMSKYRLNRPPFANYFGDPEVKFGHFCSIENESTYKRLIRENRIAMDASVIYLYSDMARELISKETGSKTIICLRQEDERSDSQRKLLRKIGAYESGQYNDGAIDFWINECSKFDHYVSRFVSEVPDGIIVAQKMLNRHAVTERISKYLSLPKDLELQFINRNGGMLRRAAPSFIKRNQRIRQLHASITNAIRPTRPLEKTSSAYLQLAWEMGGIVSFSDARRLLNK